MHCPACDYLNPKDGAVCTDCGAGLLWTSAQKAEVRFRDQLGTTVDRAQDRYRRAIAGEPDGLRPRRPRMGPRPDPGDL